MLIVEKILSVVIPCYNGENVIKKCVGNTVSQMTPDIELILINNGSTDNTGALIEQYARDNDNVKAFEIEKNRGVSFARNMGLSLSQGEYVLFVDCDDIVPKGTLKKYIESIKKTHPDIVCGNFKQLRNGICYDHSIIERKDNLYETVMEGNGIWNKAFRRSMLVDNNITYRTEYNYGEDTLFVAETLLFAEKIVLIKKVVYERMVYENEFANLTRQYHLGNLIEYVSSGIETYSMKYSKYPQKSVYEKHLGSLKYVWLYWQHLEINEKREGFKELQRYVAFHEWDDELAIEFASELGVSPDVFLTISFDDYNVELNDFFREGAPFSFINCKIIELFMSGRVGVIQMLKYNVAWAMGMINKHILKKKNKTQ